MKKERKQYKIEREGIYYRVYARQFMGWKFMNGCTSLQEAETYIEDAKQFPKYY